MSSKINLFKVVRQYHNYYYELKRYNRMIEVVNFPFWINTYIQEVNWFRNTA